MARKKAAKKKVAKKKPALVLVHGYRGAPLGLEELAERLREKYEVFVPAIPPTGQFLLKYTPRVYADYLAGFLRENKIEKPVMVGHSMGSIVVAAMASDYPGLLGEQVIFLAPIAKHPPKFIAPLTPLVSVLPNGLMSRISTRYLFAGKGKDLYRKCLDLTVKCGGECGNKQESRMAAKFSCKYGIGDFEFPQRAAFVVGAKDRLANMRDIKRLARAQQGGKMHRIEGCGHLLNYERPDEVARVIEGILG